MADWTDDQRANAATIIATGEKLGASTRDIRIALMAALTESSLHNVSYGDRDSVGLFQQRAAWGTFDQRTNPAESARMFFMGGHGGQRGLFSFADRDQMGLGEAAQAVQVSAYPDRYDEHQSQAEELLSNAGKLKTPGTLGEIPDLDEVVRQAAQAPTAPADPMEGVADDGTDPGVSGDGALEDPLAAVGASPTSNPLAAMDFSSGMQHAAEATELPTDAELQAQSALTNGGGGRASYGGATYNPISSSYLPSLEDFGITPDMVDGNVPTTDVNAKAGWRKAVVKAAHKMLGVPYVWGAESPSGVDCSGLVQLIYNQHGFNLPRISFQQADSGQRIPIQDARPGDLIAYDNSGRNPGADHIAIAIGDGMMIEAPHPGADVQVSKIYDGGWAVRLPDPAGYVRRTEHNSLIERGSEAEVVEPVAKPQRAQAVVTNTHASAIRQNMER